jgi:peptidoglycan/LPS O-acetylase OafA/YrhL
MHTRRVKIDALKVLGAQLIFLHHASPYSPIGDALSEGFPLLMDAAFEFFRMAVQIFLVVGGYLAVAALEPAARARTGSLWQILVRRYQRLVLPFLVATVLCMAVAALVRPWFNTEFVPQAPNLGQVFAHVFLLHSVLGYESLSAGAWYVAMDFQLFALLAILLRWGYRAPGLPRLAHWMVVGLMVLSLYFFNRNEAWDAWAVYFFGAYGLGAAARWIGRSRYPELMIFLLASLVLGSLWVDFRERIAIALTVGMVLGIAQWAHVRHRHLGILPDAAARLIHRLGKSSYAFFLVHFPVLLLGNALFFHLQLAGPAAAGAMLLACWAASIAAAFVFTRWVEEPLAHWGYRRNILSTQPVASGKVQSKAPRMR